MIKIFRWFRNWTKSAFQSLAFLPLPIAVIGVGLGMLLFYLETQTTLTRPLVEELPYVIFNSEETARSALNLIVAGMITLTVFTFTQMMTLFSQVASNYSPRLLPMFTGSRKLQFVMGTYLAVIIISVIVLFSIRSEQGSYVPNFSVLICLGLGVFCLLLFIYFVTTVSNKIQVSNILKNVYERGERALKATGQRRGFIASKKTFAHEDWYVIPSPIGGFIGTVDYDRLSELARRYATRFYLATPRGRYVPRCQPLVYSEVTLDESQVREVLAAVSPVRQKYLDWELPPIRLLTEIAVKAMSPGINDPMTAIDTIDRLTGLLLRLLSVPNCNLYVSPGASVGEVWFAYDAFDVTLGEMMQPLRQYCKADVLVTRRLSRMLFHLKASVEAGTTYEQTVIGEIMALVADGRAELTNRHDRDSLAEAIREQRRGVRQYRQRERFLSPSGED